MTDIIQKMNDAYARTTPHPLDPYMRITQNKADICAAFHHQARAVIWKRGFSQSVSDAIDTMNNDDFVLQAHKVKSSVRMNTAFRLPPSGLDIMPKAIIDDVNQLRRELKEELFRFNGYFHCSAYDQAVSFEDLLADWGTYLPHSDSTSKNPTRPALIYTNDPMQTSEWYPGSFSHDDLDQLWDDLYDATTLEELEAVKRAYGKQNMEPGDVLILKPQRFDEISLDTDNGSKIIFPPLDIEETLIHGASVPVVGKPRFGLLSLG